MPHLYLSLVHIQKSNISDPDKLLVPMELNPKVFSTRCQNLRQNWMAELKSMESESTHSGGQQIRAIANCSNRASDFNCNGSPYH